MKRALLSLLIAGTAVVAGTASAATQEYRLTVLGLDSYATGINNLGQVVGASLVNGQYVATVWTNGVASYLPSVGGSESYATDINNLGVVSGAAKGADGKYHAVTWNNGVATVLNGTDIGVANAVNDAGVVVGSITSAGGNIYAQQWSNGAATMLGYGNAYDINNHGAVVVGDLLIDGTTRTNLAAQYPEWDTHGGELTPLPATAYAINDAGVAAGAVGDHYGFVSTAVIWGPNGVISGSLYDPPLNRFKGINNAGLAVGEAVYDPAFYPSEAILWNGSALVNLNSLLSASDHSVHLGNAEAINDSGVIVGQLNLLTPDPQMPGVIRHAAYILTPVPEPETYAMLAAGLLLMGAMARRRKDTA